MKIGILTLPFNNNYGGLLQSYALQTYLRKRNHEVNVLNIKMVASPMTFVQRIKSGIKFMCGKTYRDRKKYENLSQNMTSFVAANMSVKYYKSNNENYNLDAFIVGSDQVWRFDYTKENYKKYFLDFVEDKNVKRIAYAASFGIDNWNLSIPQTKEIVGLIKKFDAVSVRENSGIELCKDNLEIEAQQMIDPAMLLTKNDYLKLVDSSQDNVDEDLLVYMLDLDLEKKELIKKITEELNYKPFTVGLQNLDNTKKNIYPPISNWLNGFLKAKFIITDSFHGTAFAILFNKPFITYGNSERGITRFDSILNQFNLKSRYISKLSDLNSQIIHEEIKFTEINAILDKKRSEANFFFKSVQL